MNIHKTILSYIQQIPMKEPFTTRTLGHLASGPTVRQTLHRLVLEKKIARVGRGIYARTTYSEALERHLPVVGIPEILKSIEKETGELIAMHGSEAVRYLRLSTQAQLKPIYYTTGRSRNIKLGNTMVKLRHISPRKIVNHGSVEEIVILALWHLQKKQVSTQTLHHIENLISPEKFKKVAECICYMPAWMPSVFYQYRKLKEG